MRGKIFATLVLAPAMVATIAASAIAVTWNSVPMSADLGNADSIRSWMTVDQATGDIYASRWDQNNYKVTKLTAAKAANYGVTTAADWTTIAGPTGTAIQNGQDNGSTLGVYNGKLYAVFGTDAGAANRKVVRMDLATGVWDYGTKTGLTAGDWGLIYGGFVTAGTGAETGKTVIFGQWCGTRRYYEGVITSEGAGTFTYDSKAYAGDLPAYWGVDAAVGTDGYAYFYGNGLTNGVNQLRRASLADTTTVQTSMVTPWVDAQGISTDQNGKKGAAIEFIPGANTASGSNELWVLAGRTNAGTLLSQIDRYDAATGAFLGFDALPFTLTDEARGYDMIYNNGTVYLMAGHTDRAGTPQALWSASLVPVPEPGSLMAMMVGLSGLAAGCKLRRRSH